MYLVKINQKLQFLGMSDAMNKFHGIYDVYVLGENKIWYVFTHGALEGHCGPHAPDNPRKSNGTVDGAFGLALSTKTSWEWKMDSGNELPVGLKNREIPRINFITISYIINIGRYIT